VAARVVESAVIAIGIASLLAVVTLRQDLAGEAAGLDTVGRSLVAIHDWTFLLGPGFCVGVGNGLLLGYLMYRSGLVPRRMALLGLIGGPLIFVSSTAVVFGAYEQTDGGTSSCHSRKSPGRRRLASISSSKSSRGRRSSTSTQEWSRAPGAPRWLRGNRPQGSGAAMDEQAGVLWHCRLSCKSRNAIASGVRCVTGL
jgi:hypothetical protein